MSYKKSYEDAVKELSLMLMYLTRVQDNNEFCPYRELSWKGYDFQLMDQLSQEDLIYQPRSRRGYDKYLYLTASGRQRAQELLEEYGLCDKALNERYEFRSIFPHEADQAADIENICFPPHEACTPAMMKDRIEKVPDLFLVAVDRATGQIAGFLNGIATNEYSFRDEFFSDASLHDPSGKNIMLLGLDVLPQHRGQGLAKEIVFQYLRREWEKGRKMLLLTCLKPKVKMYKRMGFRDQGIAKSSWGGEQWHEMSYVLNI